MSRSSNPPPTGEISVCPKPAPPTTSLGCVQNRVPPTGQFGCVQKWVHQLASLGVSKNGSTNWPVWRCPKSCLGGAAPAPSPAPRPPGQSAGPNSTSPKAHPANWRAPGPPEPTSARPATAQVPRADWRVPPTARRGPRGARPSTAPLQAPGAAGALDGEVLTNKSSQGRADAQRLVATRLLDRVHDPLGHFSRLQRIYPRAR